MALFTGYVCDTIDDGYDVYLDTNYLGLIGGNDLGSGYCGGPVGNFIYENDSLIALNDDVSNEVMVYTDALVLANTYLNHQTTSFSMNFEAQKEDNYSNAIWAFFLTHTTPCDTFHATVSPDTLICYGDSAQLIATGGQAYEWKPQAGLSCYDCPNPVASPDSSTLYTARIWNTDSCSKVLPVHVLVNRPKPDSIGIDTATCGESNGRILLGEISELSQPPFVYSLNGNQQSTGNFNNLPAGEYFLEITDNAGCSWSDSLTVPEVNLAQAGNIQASPDEGYAPLEVNFISTSVFEITDYMWLIEADTLYGPNVNYTFEEAGQHTVTLIAYNHEPHCADTATATVVVYPAYFMHIPNVFTPNGDGKNDQLTVKVQSVQSIRWQVFNRWGKQVAKGEQKPNGQNTEIPLWDGRVPSGQKAVAGTYYLLITSKDMEGAVYEERVVVSLVR